MTDRYNYLTVALEKNIRADDAQPLINAIAMLRGVLQVEPNIADSEAWLAEVRVRQEFTDKLWALTKKTVAVITLLFAAGIVATARADEPIEGELTLGQVRELQIALSSIERREGTCDGKPCSIPVPTCLGDIKPPCIPLAISAVIADDLAALAPQWQFYQAEAHKLIGDASGGSGYVAPGSKEEVIANYRLFDLNGQKVTVRMRQIDVHGLEASGVQLPPSIKAVISPIAK
jgi:hypothetical protein